ncbi:uncharacterized protein LOC108219350 [Daucus carota subsp. sativus]|uniref:uncharacterized protein LOC108219350 n=1 Tax=Daucus carota subsp. sativus TaxID=79200 RepID=UPI0007EF0825|nr:PREDICTED: uncharacterized protein LOC108219350 [Daucus carota subsp. sativus]
MDNTTRFILDIMDAEEEEEEQQTRMRMNAAYLHNQREKENFISYHGGSTMNHRVIDRNREEGHVRLQRTDAVGIRGMSSLQKVTAALRMLAYGTTADAVDDYVRIAENEQRGFPGMLASIDCMHWKWKNCPTGWQGMYTGHVHEPTIILEAIASKDLWIWHAFFGLPWSLNDINVLDRSHLFEEYAEGSGPEVRYTINGHEYNMSYYLADGIYPSWLTFVKTIPKLKVINKDILQLHKNPFEKMFKEHLECTISDERDLHAEEEHFEAYDEPTVTRIPSHPSSQGEFIQVHQQIRDKQAHVPLQNDLVEHLWQIMAVT